TAQITIVYTPNELVLDISKLSRIADTFSRRLQPRCRGTSRSSSRLARLQGRRGCSAFFARSRRHARSS
ncbi:hypothetical protein BC834DRAFT_820569, partial [Gloeopeniophorella convolvens]